VVALVVAVRWSSPDPALRRDFQRFTIDEQPGQRTQSYFLPRREPGWRMLRTREQEDYDIYVKVIGSTSQLRLTSTKDVDHSPAWSPDGRSIAFLRWEKEKPESIQSRRWEGRRRNSSMSILTGRVSRVLSVPGLLIVELLP